MSLCRLSEIEALLPCFLGLDHFVSHYGFQNVVPLVVVVHASSHISSVLATALIYHVRHLLTCQAMGLILQSALEFTHVGGILRGRAPLVRSAGCATRVYRCVHSLVSDRIDTIMQRGMNRMAKRQVSLVTHKSLKLTTDEGLITDHFMNICCAHEVILSRASTLSSLLFYKVWSTTALTLRILALQLLNHFRKITSRCLSRTRDR